MFLSWLEFDGFPYSVFIIPIGLVIAFLNHNYLVRAGAVISPLGLLLLLLTCVGVTVSQVAEITILKEISILLIIPMTIFALCGWHFASTISYPLAILLFFIPTFNYFSTFFHGIFTKSLLSILSLLNQQVYWENNTLIIGEKNILINENIFCIKYFFASILFSSFITYFSNSRLLSIIVKSFMIGIFTFTSNILIVSFFSTLNDSLSFISSDFYSYILYKPYFSLLIVIFFSSVFFFKRSKMNYSYSIPIFMYSGNRDSYNYTRWFMPTVLCTGIIMIIPWFSNKLPDLPWQKIDEYKFSFPEKNNAWNGPYKTNVLEWNKSIEGIDKIALGMYKNNYDNVMLFASYSDYFKPKVTSLNSDTIIYNKNYWSVIKEDTKVFSLPSNKKIKVREILLKRGNQKRIVWQWYQIGQVNMTNKNAIKLLESLRIITKYNKPSGIIAIATDFDYDVNNARNVLSNFITEVKPTEVLS